MQINSFISSFIRVVVVVLVIAGPLPGCKKYLDIGAPPDKLTPEKGYIDSLTSLSSVLSMYGYYYTSGGNDFILNNSRVGAAAADEGYYFDGTNQINFKNNTLTIGNDASIAYDDPYFIIGIANANIEGLAKTTGISTAFKNQLMGESKFWRAYVYYFLVNNFGGVPLPVNTDAITNALKPKATPAEVWKQITDDLKDAKQLLADNYPSPDRARINKKAVSAMLARAYLYQNNFTEAAREASEVIDFSGVYRLESDLSQTFLKTSNEVIWQLSNTTGATRIGAAYIPSGTTPTFVLYDTLTKTFEPGDKRKTTWTKPIVSGAVTYYHPFKYKLRTATAGNEYTVLLRLSEQYLIRAEARLKNGDKPGAIRDVDSIRRKAGLPLIATTNPGISDAALIELIDHERWVELFTESSDRWFNLKRRGNVGEVLKKIKPQWQDYQALFPFPLLETTSNKNLVQNPGYER